MVGFPCSNVPPAGREGTVYLWAFVIPRNIHFVWSGNRFPTAFALAVHSAAAHHPEWKIVVHVGEEPTGVPAWESLRSVAEIRRIRAEELLDSVPGVGPRLVELHGAIAPQYHAGRSNLVRLAILVREGGWYLDFDTLTIASFEDLSIAHSAIVGEEWVWNHDEERVRTGYRAGMLPSTLAFGLSWLLSRAGVGADSGLERSLRDLWGRLELNNAVLACEPEEPWFRRLLELATLQDPSVRFALGPSLVNRAWREPGLAPLPTRMPPSAFYQFPPSQTNRYFGGGSRTLPLDAKILHWCSSNHRDILAELGKDWVARHAESSPWARHALPHTENLP